MCFKFVVRKPKFTGTIRFGNHVEEIIENLIFHVIFLEQ